MPDLSLANELPMLACALTERARGNWTADIEVATEETVSGAVALVLQGVALSGHTVRGGLDGGVWRGRIEGGNGTMRKHLASRYYVAAVVRTVLSDIVSDSSEALSLEIAPSIMSASLARWARPSGPVERAVDDLATKLGVGWRVLRDGSVWLGAERFEQPDIEYTEISRSRLDTVTIAPQVPLVGPGNLFDGRKVGDVSTRLSKSSLEQTIAFADDSEKGRLQAIVERLFDKFIGRRVDFSGSYPAKVVSQSADGSLEVLIDDARLRGDGLKSVPIRLGVPGTRCTVAAGARVRIHFDNQDQALPFAALWDTNPADVTLIEVGSGTGYLSRAEKVATEFGKVSQDLATLKGAIASALTTIDAVTLTASAGTFSSTTAAVPSSYSSTACTTLKAK